MTATLRPRRITCPRGFRLLHLLQENLLTRDFFEQEHEDSLSRDASIVQNVSGDLSESVSEVAEAEELNEQLLDEDDEEEDAAANEERSWKRRNNGEE